MQRDITYIVFRLGYLCVLPLLAGAAPSPTFSNPDFTKSQARPEGATHDWNLGPTGMRGWMYSNKMETSEARQILITSVDSLSPADQLIMEGDVILGVAKKRFSYDPRGQSLARLSHRLKHPMACYTLLGGGKEISRR